MEEDSVEVSEGATNAAKSGKVVDEKLTQEVHALADSVKLVRTDVYTLHPIFVILNLVIGAGAIAALIAALFNMNTVTFTVCIFVAIGALVVIVAYNLAIRLKGPMSYTEYFGDDNGRRCYFMNFSKRWAFFSDGTNHIESDRMYVKKRDGMLFEQYRFDFFTDMQVYSKTEKNGFTTYTGEFTCREKTYKAKLKLNNGELWSATINGARLKYFDVNSTTEKYNVTPLLFDALKAAKVEWPKLSTVTHKAPKKEQDKK